MKLVVLQIVKLTHTRYTDDFMFNISDAVIHKACVLPV